MTITDLVQALRDSTDAWVFKVEEGRKYYKVMQALVDQHPHWSVHAFVDKNTGDIYKPASWRGPAKGVRGNLSTFDPSKVDPYMSWLYRR